MPRLLLVYLFVGLITQPINLFGQADAPNLSNEALESLALEIDGYIESNLALGAEIFVVKDGTSVFHRSFGHSDFESKRNWENNTVCNIRSMTKPLTSAAAQILIDRGQLQLDETVGTYLASFANDKCKQMTVEQVLTHRSGMPTGFVRQPYQFDSLQEQVSASAEAGPQFPPGEKFWYSDPGTDIVAALVEKITGETIDKFVEREIFAPMNLQSTFYGIDKSDQRLGKAASTYMKTKQGWAAFWKPAGRPLYPFAWGSQTVYSTTEDYAKFMNMLANQGDFNGTQILSKEAVARMSKPVSRATGMGTDVPMPTGFRNLKPWYGQMLLTWHDDSPQSVWPTRVIGHSGSDGTAAWSWPEHGLTIVYFTQSRGGLTPVRIEFAIDDIVLHPRNSTESAGMPEEWKPLLGKYTANFGSFDKEEFTIRTRNGKLVLDIPSQLPFTLLPPDSNGNRAFEIDERIKIRFQRNDNKEVVGFQFDRRGNVGFVPRNGFTEPPTSEEVKLKEGESLEIWEGSIATGRNNLRLQLHIIQSDSETTGFIRSVDQANQKIEIDVLTKTNKQISFSSSKVKASYEGTISEDGKTSTGTFTQNGKTIPLSFDLIDDEKK